MKSQEKMKIYVDIAYNDKGRRIGSGFNTRLQKFLHFVKNRFTITANNMKSQEKMKIYVDIAYNDKGRRIGSGHPRAKFTDADVEHVLMLRTTGMTTREIADKMEMSESTVRSYIRGVRRSQPPMSWKRKEIECGK